MDRLREFVRFLHDFAVVVTERFRMAHEAVGELMGLLVCAVPRELTGLQQRQANRLVTDSVSVFIVSQKCNAEAGLGEIAEAMASNLETRLVPRGIRVNGSPHGTTANLECGEIGPDVQREVCFE